MPHAGLIFDIAQILPYMKRIASILALCAVVLASTAQQTTTLPTVSDSSDISVWMELMAQPNANYHEVKAAYDKYFETHPKGKGTGWKVFERWAWHNEYKTDPDGNLPPPGLIKSSWDQYKAAKGDPANPGTWTEVGPVQLPTNITGQPNGLGRINGFGFHPSDANTVWAGAPAGGLWKTTDAGANWTMQNTDFLATLGVSSILIDPTSTNTIYIGTGDRDAGDAPGLGVYYSTDGGSTWSARNNGMGNRTVGMMIMDPSNSSIIVAATNGGIYKTTDGGANWARTSSTTNNFRDIRFKPGDFNTQYATESGDFWRSTDAGNSWTAITSGLPGAASRLVLGVSPAAPNTVYALCSGSAPFEGLYRSTDSGQNWSAQSTTPNILGYSSTGSDGSSQGWYDLCLTVDRTNANVLYAGGINVWKSTDGGVNWTISAHWVGGGGLQSIHADQHALEVNPIDNKVWNGNDGGVYTTSDGGTTWVDRSDDLGVSQIYRIGQSFVDREITVAGFQDNGMALWDNGTWSTIAGGDGMDCTIDYQDPQYVYSTYIYTVRRSSNYGYGSNYTVASDGTHGITESGAWVAPFILHKTDPNTMFLGYKNVWRTNNIRSSPPTWTKISDNLGGSNSSNIHKLDQSKADLGILYVSRQDNRFFRSDNVNDVTPTWTDLTASVPFGNNPADVKAHPTNSEVVYVVADNKVWKSSDRGATWVDYSGSIPSSIPINTICIDETKVEALYVGTDVSVFYRDTSMTDWMVYDGGLPITEVTELEMFYGYTDSRVRACTYGRGLWETPAYHDPSLAPIANFEADATTVSVGDTVSFTDISAHAPTGWTWTISPATITYCNGTNASSANPQVRFDAGGTYSIGLQATNANGSDTKTVPTMVQAFATTASPCNGATTNLGNYGMGIFRVAIGDIDHTSSQAHIDAPSAPAGYVNNYPGISTKLQPNNSYNITVNTGTSYNQYVSVYIDYNNDGDFLDAGEEVWDDTNYQGDHTTSITTPASPAMNQTLRMRVIGDWSNPGSACHNPSYGQVEDYAVIFTNPPALTTTAASSITASTASSGGNVSAQGSSAVTQRGIVWSIHPNPTLAENWGYTSDGSGLGNFTSSLTDLMAGTTYYVRAYAINSSETAYGQQETFTTADRAPVLTTTAVTPSFTTAAGGGNITSDGGLTITARGVIYSTSSGVTLGNYEGITNDGTGSGVFASTLTGLAANTTYYARAYATNAYSTVLGNEVTFTTLPPDPNQAKDITFSNVDLTSMTVSWTNGNRTSRIVIMNTANTFTDPVNGTDPAANPTYGGSGEQVIYNGTGNSVAVAGLTEETTYYFRVYEKNGSGGSTDYSVSAADNNPNGQATYCEPTYSNTPVGTNFTNFAFNTINNASGATQYSDFTNISTNLTPGSTYSADFTMSYNNTTTDLWIDFNDNAVFEVSEKLIDNLSTPSSTTTSQNVTIPVSANLGTHRMRIRCNWGTNGDACNNWNWGEAEDYTVTIGSNFLTQTPRSITHEGATCRGSINPNGSTVTNIKFEWGTTTAYGGEAVPASTSATGSSDVDFTASISGLERGEEYHYRISGDVGGTTYYGQDMVLMVPPGNMCYFDGIDDYVQVPDHTDYQFGSTTDFTVEFWLEVPGAWAGDPSLVSSKDWNSGTNAGWNIALSNTGAGIDVNVGDGTNRADIDAGEVNDAAWHHIAVVFDRDAAVTLYVDGREVQNATMSSVGNVNNGLNIGIGQDGTGSYGSLFRGRLDEVRLWSDVRSQTEIRRNMHLNMSGSEANLVGYWPGHASSNTMYELVNGNHGTLYNVTVRPSSDVPMGSGVSASDVVTTGGTYTFGATGVTMGFPASGTYPDGELVVSRVNGNPDALPGAINSNSRSYWVVRNFGNNSTFTELDSFVVANIGEVTAAAQGTPNQIKLFKRSSGESGSSWGSEHAVATTAWQGADGKVRFGTDNNIQSFSQIMLGDNAISLPVELLFFSATPENGERVRLAWETASQRNLNRFEVERSGNGNSYGMLARVEGIPNTNYPQQYETYDTDPLPGLSYYRLKSVDNDGSFEYSPAVAVRLDGESTVVIAPNPVQAGGNIRVLSSSTQPLQLTLFNGVGQRVRVVTVSGSANIDLTGLAAGVYQYTIGLPTGDANVLQTGKLVISE